MAGASYSSELAAGPEAGAVLVGEQGVHHRRGAIPPIDGAARLALHEGRATLPAVERTPAVRRRAARAVAGHAVLLHAQQALHLRQLGVAFLQHRRAAHEHVEAEVVADGHLVGEPAQVPVQLGHLLGERVAPAAQVRARSSCVAGTGGEVGAAEPGGADVALAGGRCAAADSGLPWPNGSRRMPMRLTGFDHVGKVLGSFLVALALGPFEAVEHGGRSRVALARAGPARRRAGAFRGGARSAVGDPDHLGAREALPQAGAGPFRLRPSCDRRPSRSRSCRRSGC